VFQVVPVSTRLSQLELDGSVYPFLPFRPKRAPGQSEGQRGGRRVEEGMGAGINS